ncbi:MAG TPA: MFS transporter [Gaiellaceae bacterium]|nr:MFS transporter [Gaiellaceae bacterium]
MIRSRPIGALLVAEAVSSIGTRLTWLALPWFVLVTTGSPTRMGFVFVAELVPMALLGVPSGAVVQRFGARQTMLACDLARAPIVAAVPVLHHAGLLTYPLILVLTAAMGVFTAPYFASQRLVLPEIVGEDEQLLAQANSLVEGTTRFTMLLGNAVAGVFIAWLGAANVLWLDAATFLFAFTVVALLVPRGRPVAAEEEASGILAGVKYIARDRLLVVGGVAVLGFGLLLPFVFASLPVLAFVRYDEDPKIAGWLLASWGAGALAGAGIAYRAVARFEPLRLAGIACVVMVAPLWLLVLDLPAWGVGVVLFTSALFIPLINAPFLAVLTRRTPVSLRPKVMTALVSAESVTGPIGYALAGPALAGLGLQTVYFVAAVGMTLVALMFLAATARAEPAGLRAEAA